MINYKHYSSENIQEFINNPVEMKEAFTILMQKLITVQPITLGDLSSFKRDLLKKNNHFFVMKLDAKVVGVCLGNLKKDSFFVKSLFIDPKYHNVGLGKKLKIRVSAFMSSRYNVSKIESGFVLSSKIYSINESIANRKSKSSKKYSLEKKSENYIDRNRKLKPKTNIIIKKRAGRK
jgi:hypothetical protein